MKAVSVELAAPKGVDLDFIKRQDDALRKAVEALTARVHGETELNLCPLLEQRRLQHLIPAGAFSSAPGFDWVFVYQIAERDSTALHETFGDGPILKTDRAKEQTRDESPRGVIVAAGPKALDHLRTNGMDLGHVVRFVKLSPFRIIIDNVAGKDFCVLVMRTESIVSSEDFEQARRRGDVAIKWHVESEMHVLADRNGDFLKPQETWTPEDYK